MDPSSVPAPVPEPSKEELAHNIQSVNARVAAATAARSAPFNIAVNPPRLVAASKTKSAKCLNDLYETGHCVFGENYVQELLEKVSELPTDTIWHFIGHLQSNKASVLVESVPNLSVVETVDTEKLAKKLNNAVETFWTADTAKKLQVYVQVNTSGEESKSGVEPTPEALLPLVRFIVKECPRLTFAGLMTIGMPDYTSKPENFECLWKCRDLIAHDLQVEANTLELSMGMSGDFEAAIGMGATNMRVGTSIFGARNYHAELRLKK